MEDYGMETFGVLVTIQSIEGYSCVYRLHSLENIIREGCRVKGYNCEFSDCTVPFTIDGEHQIIKAMVIKPKN